MEVAEHRVFLLRSIFITGEMIQNGTSFDANLYRLMQKADNKNWRILSRAFPTQAREFVNWLKQEDINFRRDQGKKQKKG